MTITQVHPIAVVFTLPQDDLPAINEAMATRQAAGRRLRRRRQDASSTSGTLLTPDNAIDPTTGTIKLKATFPNADNTLWPGQFVNARLLLGTEQQRADGAVGRGAARARTALRLCGEAGFDGGAAGGRGRARRWRRSR